MKKRSSLALVILTAACALVQPISAQTKQVVLPATGVLSKQTISRLMLTDAVRSGNRVLAVGDRGYIVYSDSNGDKWERAKTPEKLPMLNAVVFADEKTAWAVGHDSVILKSVDQGQTWEKAFSSTKELTPLMDIAFLDANVGFAVGAYGTCLQTNDGGKTWQKRKVIPAAPVAKQAKRGGRAAEADDGEMEKGIDEDRHLNAIVNLGNGKLVIVGEAGMALKSEDAGKTWVKVVTPYRGSFFGALRTKEGGLVVYGLRGNVFSVDSAFKTWTPVVTDTKASFMGGVALADGTIALVGLSGTLMLSRDGGKTFTVQPTGSTKALSSVALSGSNGLLLFGEAGVRDVVLSSAK